ncbi:MAG TPA: tRNA guanosine(34) transglycosylase Tgt [Candidatus Peribacteraceae bacterium]|nr:tRNA guanosine(34) transglycosylase Tgt [Candidatus Peribacteraceae bacterium]
MFELLSHSTLGRRGRIATAHGVIETPVFFPVGTAGAMRGITLDDLKELGSNVLLCNTYHLHLQPGENVIEEAGGLHQFIGWDGPILTDSGGFQVFSLESNRKIVDHGVRFRSHIDGRALFLGPEEAMRIQHALGSDIIMCFDECPPSTAPRKKQIEAVDRTLRWAKECKAWHEKLKSSKGPTKSRGSKLNNTSVPSVPLLFGIIQGGLERDLREKCAQELIAIGFDGYAVGGLAVGETENEMYDVLDIVCPLLPEDKPRYLMGVGRISQHREAIKRGIDIFDCVMPMREARHGKIYLSDTTHINILNNKFVHDHSVIDSHSTSPLSRKHLKSYLNHLFHAKERSAQTIACMQNMAVTLEAMRSLRAQMDA